MSDTPSPIKSKAPDTVPPGTYTMRVCSIGEVFVTVEIVSGEYKGQKIKIPRRTWLQNFDS